MSSRFRACAVIVVLLAGLASACGGPDRPVQVTAIQVGSSRNADKTVARPTFDFKPSDTIYATVLLDGRASNVTVKVHWTMPGALDSESEQTLPVRDTGIASFELRSSGGFPPGRYRLEVFLDGVSVGTRDIRVTS